MAIDFIVGIPVNDFAAALACYERLLGTPPTFVASDTEAVWELAEHQSPYIAQLPEHADHLMFSLSVDDLDARVAQIAARELRHGRRVMREALDGDQPSPRRYRLRRPKPRPVLDSVITVIEVPGLDTDGFYRERTSPLPDWRRTVK